jgi:hypothetical protein
MNHLGKEQKRKKRYQIYERNAPTKKEEERNKP